MDIRLDGRTAIITGGSKGLGLATAVEFARSGADVAILARGLPGIEAALATITKIATGRVAGFVCDVAKAEDITDAYDKVMATFGKVDILVNNAGESRLGPFEAITDAMWQDDIDQKLMAAVRLTRLAWAQMKDRRWGRVINVLAINAKHYRSGSAPTSVSRAAGLALTKVLAGEGAPHNVLVNALMVGSIASDQIVRRHEASTTDKTLEELIEDAGKTVPLGRIGRPEEFANMACFLASDAASYITGSAIPVDGGKLPTI